MLGGEIQHPRAAGDHAIPVAAHRHQLGRERRRGDAAAVGIGSVGSRRTSGSRPLSATPACCIGFIEQPTRPRSRYPTRKVHTNRDRRDGGEHELDVTDKEVVLPTHHDHLGSRSHVAAVVGRSTHLQPRHQRAGLLYSQPAGAEQALTPAWTTAVRAGRRRHPDRAAPASPSRAAVRRPSAWRPVHIRLNNAPATRHRELRDEGPEPEPRPGPLWRGHEEVTTGFIVQAGFNYGCRKASSNFPRQTRGAGRSRGLSTTEQPAAGVLAELARRARLRRDELLRPVLRVGERPPSRRSTTATPTGDTSSLFAMTRTSTNVTSYSPIYIPQRRTSDR